MWSAVGANILPIFVRFKLFEIFTIPELFLQSYHLYHYSWNSLWKRSFVTFHGIWCIYVLCKSTMSPPPCRARQRCSDLDQQLRGGVATCPTRGDRQMTGVELRERVEETELGGASLRRLEEEVGQENLSSDFLLNSY